jgi:hypothetical protein
MDHLLILGAVAKEYIVLEHLTIPLQLSVYFNKKYWILSLVNLYLLINLFYSLHPLLFNRPEVNNILKSWLTIGYQELFKQVTGENSEYWKLENCQYQHANKEYNALTVYLQVSGVCQSKSTLLSFNGTHEYVRCCVRYCFRLNLF